MKVKIPIMISGMFAAFGLYASVSASMPAGHTGQTNMWSFGALTSMPI